MMIEKIYVPNVPVVERRPGVNTITDRAVDLDVHDHSKKQSGQELTKHNKEEDATGEHPQHTPSESTEKTGRINVVA